MSSFLFNFLFDTCLLVAPSQSPAPGLDAQTLQVAFHVFIIHLTFCIIT